MSEPIRFSCPSCRASLKVAHSKVGRLVTCPKCAADFVVPDPNAPTPVPESPPAEPAGTWLPDHAVGDLVEELTSHDRHHAETIKRWREQSGA